MYSTEPNKKNKSQKKTTKNKKPNQKKPHRKSNNNSCGNSKHNPIQYQKFRGSFGNCAYNIKKMKYKKASFTRINRWSSYTISNLPNFDNLSDTENIRMLTDTECVGMMLRKLVHERQNKTKTSKMIFFKQD